MTDAAWIGPMRFVSTADEKVARIFDAPSGFIESLDSLGVLASHNGIIDTVCTPHRLFAQI